MQTSITGAAPGGVTGLRREIVGIDTRVPLLDGTERPYVFLDNAASTPALRGVLRAIEEFLPWYSGVHRGTGFKSVLATGVFDAAHDAIGRFVGADPARTTVIFTKNTTECINKVSNRFQFAPGDVVITTVMEHHSNDLPWRKNARFVHVRHHARRPPGPRRHEIGDRRREGKTPARGRERGIQYHRAMLPRA